MIRALLMIFDAGGSWARIGRAQRGFLFVFFLHLLPLAVMTLGAEAYAMTRLGEGRTITGDLIPVTREAALRYLVSALVLNLGVILVGAKAVERIGRSLDCPTSYRPCFTLLAYGMSPLFLLHLLDALPGVNTWVCFGIGIALSVGALYLGIPIVLRPDPAKAMGLYLIISVLMLMMSGLAHFLVWQILRNELNPRFWEQLVH